MKFGNRRNMFLGGFAALACPRASRGDEIVRLVESVNAQQFAAELALAQRSALLSAELTRHRNAIFDDTAGKDFAIHRGDLRVRGDWVVPALQMLVIGNLNVGNLLDLTNPHAKGFDEGGAFIVLGNVTCRAFAGEGGKLTMIDGNLTAKEAIANDFEDSAMIVAGDVRTRFFKGEDIWIETGGAADIAFGDGYCLPIGYTNAVAQAILPRHDRETSLAMLDPVLEPQSSGLSDRMRERIRAGRSIFRNG